ncbi:hypothetical protein A4A49_12483 [Nicotiana attenuata]|uniref:Uncharacterized protein n=1 Tax=Nicotiana attenuata TaxID=49451 RepID=A0A314KNA9_NICAT|nr:hypothetical protein A4A49_12483 [Nicotiana attenuata]
MCRDKKKKKKCRDNEEIHHTVDNGMKFNPTVNIKIRDIFLKDNLEIMRKFLLRLIMGRYAIRGLILR